jgi:hypothetical protein
VDESIAGPSAAPLNEATWGRVLLLKLDGLVKEIGTTLGKSTTRPLEMQQGP